MITKQRQAEREGREGESEEVGEIKGDACGQELRNKERTNRVKGKGGSEIRQHREDGSGLRKEREAGKETDGICERVKTRFQGENCMPVLSTPHHRREFHDAAGAAESFFRFPPKTFAMLLFCFLCFTFFAFFDSFFESIEVTDLTD